MSAWQHTLGVDHYFIVSTVLFVIGLWGMMINRRQIIFMMLCMELSMLAVILNFAAFAHFKSDLFGHVAGLFILTVAAAEAAIGLALIVALFRLSDGNIRVEDMNTLKDSDKREEHKTS
ncbi:MAG: NADH-quinone oxidoreductase subunit NuoK [Alphaproteobacteria bacterium GM202ARS2]|nr:NADH-quinone oxidoreductase subunit NuoK [Alphaproteobacteria bacterium GM202ARS2]